MVIAVNNSLWLKPMKLLFSLTALLLTSNLTAKHLYLETVKGVSLQALRSYVPLASRARWARGALDLREYVRADIQIKRPELAYRRLEKGMTYVQERSITYFAPLLGLTEAKLQNYVELEKAIDKFAKLSPDELANLTAARREAFEHALHQQQLAKRWAIKSTRADNFFRSLMRVEISDLNSYDHPSSAAIIKNISNRYDDVSELLGYSWLEESKYSRLVPESLPSLEKITESFAQEFSAKLKDFDLMHIAAKDAVIRNFRILRKHQPDAIEPVLQEYLAAKDHHELDQLQLHQRLEKLANLVIADVPAAEDDTNFIKAIVDLSEHVGRKQVIAALTSNPPTIATMMRTARGNRKLRTLTSQGLGYNYLTRIESGERLASTSVLPLISNTYGIDLPTIRKLLLIERVIRIYDSNPSFAAKLDASLLHALETASRNKKTFYPVKSNLRKEIPNTFANHEVSAFEHSYAEKLIQDMQDKGYTIAQLSSLTDISKDRLERIIGRATYDHARKKDLRKIAAVMGYDYEEGLAAMEIEKAISGYRHLRFVLKDIPDVDGNDFETALGKYQASKFLASLYLQGITLADIDAFAGVTQELMAKSGKGALDYNYAEYLIAYTAQTPAKIIDATAAKLGLNKTEVQRIIAIADTILLYGKNAEKSARYLPAELNQAFTNAIDRTNIRPPSNTFGELIKTTREQQRLSVTRLAELARNNNDSISTASMLKALHTIESGGAPLPYKFHPYIADTLNISMDKLQQARHNDDAINYSLRLESLLNHYDVSVATLNAFISPSILRKQGKQVSKLDEELFKIIRIYRMIINIYGGNPNVSTRMNVALKKFLD